MATEHGQDWRIEIGDGNAQEDFVPIGGETTFDWTMQSKEIDESTKDDVDISASAYTRGKISFSVSGKLKLPDAGIARASDVASTAPRKCNWRVVKGAIVKYEGQVSIGNFSTSFPNDETCTWKFDASACATPTKNDLGATA